MSWAGNNYKLLLNDQNKFGVLDMIEWKIKYTELIVNVYRKWLMCKIALKSVLASVWRRLKP